MFVVLIGLLGCSSISKFKSGKEAYGRKYFATAVQLFEKELNRNLNKSVLAEKMFLMAESYNKMDMPEKSVAWYKESIKKGGPISVYYKLSKVYKKLENYNKALKVLKKAEKNFGRNTLLLREIGICQQAKRWYDSPDLNIEINLLDINSEYSEFASDYYLQDYLAISSDRYNSHRNKYAWSGRYYYDLFISDIDGTTELSPFSKEINGKFNDASPCFNTDGTEVFFVRCGDDENEVRNCKIYRGVKKGDLWTEISVMPFVEEGVNYLSPYLDRKEDILYFASDDPRGYGGYDIYLTKRKSDKWSSPKILSKVVNTIGNEKFISGWKNELYFSSDFLPGLGGYDIFSTQMDSLNEFSPPIHFNYPINSGGDDFYFLKNSDSTGVLSSSRIKGKGQDDIYSFVIKSSDDVSDNDTVVEDKQEKKLNKKIFLAIKIVENIYAEQNNPNSRVLGKKSVEQASITFGKKENLESSSNNGVLIKEIKFDTTYSILVGKSGYLSNSIDVKIENKSKYEEEITTINVSVLLNKIYFGKEIVLDNIYYDYDKWELRDKAIPTLDILYKILKNNSGYKIRIGSHTDCRGESDYNDDLSLKRANSVVAYLVTKGINSNRLLAIGYGENKLIEKCECEKCPEKQHQKNRRTTFEILK